MRGLLSLPVSRVTLLFLLASFLASIARCNGREIERRRRPRILGIDTGNAEADREAEMWLMALIGVLVAAVPIAVLSPSLGFRRRKRWAEEGEEGDALLEAFLGALDAKDD